MSWVRRKSDKLDLLTLGATNHSSDQRILSEFKYPNNWRLAIRNTSSNDSGVYICQISTYPPKVLEVQLTVQGTLLPFLLTTYLLILLAISSWILYTHID